MAYKLIIDGAVLAKELRSINGPVGRFMMGRARVVQMAAIEQCPKRTGTLSRSIVNRYFEGPEGITITIAALQPYAIFVHDGTKPHIIAARNKPMLAFFWPNGPQGPKMYYFKSVHHPGTKPVKFLSDNIRLFWAF